MQNEPLNKEVVQAKSSSVVLEPVIKKNKNWIFILITVFVLILLVIIFPHSEFISFFIGLSIPVVIVYLSSRNAYKEVSSAKTITRSTFYSLLFIFDVIVFFIVFSLLMPSKSSEGLAAIPISGVIIIGEIVFDILVIIIYELFLKHKEKTLNEVLRTQE